MNAEIVQLERRPRGVAAVTLNRPEIHNAFDEALIARLTEVLEEVAADPSARLVLLAGAGRSFSAGADLNWMRRAAQQTESENFADAMRLAGLMRRLHGMPMPTIARIQGAAMGGGVGLAACVDLAIAAESAVFALSEVRLGIIPGAISPYVVEAIGPRSARRFFVTGERFGAAEALRVGLVHRVVAEAELDAAVASAVEQALQAGPVAARSAKALVGAVQYREIDDLLTRDTAQRIATTRATPEAQEGIAAFLEKRKPAWHDD